MANINVNDLIDLNLTGADLFNDPESFMKDLNEESEQVMGGGAPVYCIGDSCVKTQGSCLDGTGIGVVYVAQPVQGLNEFILQP